ncbi:MAG: hypothetical protein MUF54_09675 [Polyangiaceae bacterium]|nr:hypothetical protein [Polyangiaceae bacterium]
MKHLLAGVVAVCLGVWGLVSWWGNFGLVMRGLAPFLALAFGLIAMASGFRRLAESADADIEGPGLE